ncbi:MAG TPA: RnfH family protein [Burkholderiaceae bacterium]|nr:RnfH family protein [Burkholderiaceae bacterium]
MMRVEVVWSPGPRQTQVREIDLGAGATVADAARAIGLADDGLLAGVWGRRQPPGHPLRDGDRVEFYRPLRVDPKEARRLRYRGQRSTRKEKRPAKAGR